MENLGKIAGYNILFIFCYDIVLRLAMDKGSVMIISMFFVAAQVLFNFVYAIVCYSSKKTPRGHSFLLTTFLVLIIGFGVCMTNVF